MEVGVGTGGIGGGTLAPGDGPPIIGIPMGCGIEPPLVACFLMAQGYG